MEGDLQLRQTREFEENCIFTGEIFFSGWVFFSKFFEHEEPREEVSKESTFFKLREEMSFERREFLEANE